MGSFINNLLSDSSKEPEVGDGVTFLHWSDRDPGTLVEIKRFKSGARKGEISQVGVQADHWEIVSGGEHNGSATYEYSRNPEAPVVWFKRNNKGQWVKPGNRSGGLSIGRRERYYDPHF